MLRPTVAVCWRALVLVGAAAIGEGCHRPIKFTHSSLDHNRGRPHQVRVAARHLGVVLDRLVPIARQRELKLVSQHRCDQRRCLLVFHDARRSRYYVSIRRLSTGRFAVAAVGVPVLRGMMACPTYFRRAGRCKVHSILPIRYANLSKDNERDVSGAVEAEIIAGVMSRLALSSPRRLRQRTSPSPRQRPVVAVLQIDDRASTLRRPVVDQLWRYLSAAVASEPQFRLVPHDRLRTELVRRRRESYRPCYRQQCQIEIGKSLAADRVLATTLLRVGGDCALTSMLYDLRTEATERGASIRTACTAEALLGGIDQLVHRLAARSGSVPARTGSR